MPRKNNSLRTGRNTAGLRRGGPGRKPGVPNRATVEAKAACSAIIDDPRYRENLATRAREGKLAPAVECLIWHYSKGKPKETLEHLGGLAVEMSPAELVKRLSDEQLKKLVEIGQRARAEQQAVIHGGATG